MFEMSMEECIWPELNKNVGTRESIVGVDEIAKLANETGLGIEELLQVTTGDDDLKELVEQQEHKDEEISFSEDEKELKELTTNFLKKKKASFSA